MNISEINIYPIKSFKGISVESAVVEERGLRHDRRWMLTTPDGMFFTQREFPRMALIEVGVRDEGLFVTADGYGTLELGLSPDEPVDQRVTIWNDQCSGEVYPAVVSEWFSDVLETECQLVHMPGDSRRNINQLFDKGDEIVSFADGYPLLAIGEASLADLNSRLEKDLPMNRFRPNIVINGSKAFAEDDWRRFTVGDTTFRSTKPCARCVITTVDQSRGEFDGKDPLKTLATYRMAKDVMPERIESMGLSDTAVLFGQNLVSESIGATIRVGDVINVNEYY